MINHVKVLVKGPISYNCYNTFLIYNNDISFTFDIFPFDDVKSNEFNTIIKNVIKDYIIKDIEKNLATNVTKYPSNYSFNAIHISDDIKYDIIKLNYKVSQSRQLSSSKLVYSSNIMNY